MNKLQDVKKKKETNKIKHKIGLNNMTSLNDRK